MRDLIRGRITGRFDFYSQLRAAFPEPLAKHLLKIVRRTGLDLSERAQVTQELILRFSGRVHHRRPWQTLQSRLGKRRTARSLRRRYGRQRHWIRRAFDKTLLTIAYSPLVLIGLYLCAMVFFWFQKPTQSVDYLALINSPAMAVPEQDRAWPIYREAILRLELHGEQADELESRGLSPEHPGWDQATQYLLMHQSDIALLREAAGKPGLGLAARYGWEWTGDDAMALYGPRGDDPSMAAIPDAPTGDPADPPVFLSHVQPPFRQARSLARLLVADAYFAAEQSDADRFCQDIQALSGLGRHAAELEMDIGGLIGVSIRECGYGVITDVLTHDPAFLSDKHLTELKGGLENEAQDELIRYGGQRSEILDLIQRLYSDDGHGGGYMTPEGVYLLLASTPRCNQEFHPRGAGVASVILAPSMAMLFATRRAMEDMLNQSIDTYQQEALVPMWENSGSSVDDQMGKWSTLKRVRYFPISVCLRSNRGIRETTARLDAHRNGVIVGIALELYRRDHGAWPEGLDSLVPDYLESIPIDPITGGPALYLITEDQPLVYSVGTDRDDDGGRLPIDAASGEPTVREAESWRAMSKVGGDWVLYPYPQTHRKAGRERVKREAQWEAERLKAESQLMELWSPYEADSEPADANTQEPAAP